MTTSHIRQPAGRPHEHRASSAPVDHASRGPAPPDPALTPEPLERRPARGGVRTCPARSEGSALVRVRPRPSRARRSCDNPAMGRRDRFEDAAASVAGFYESWVIYLGIELGLFAAIRDAGRAGIAADAIASAAGCRPEPVRAWLAAAHAVRAGRPGRRSGDPRRGRRRGPPRRHPPRVPRRAVRHGRRLEPRLRRTDGVLPDGPDDRRAAAPLPSRDRGGDGPGHRGLLPGGAGGPAGPRDDPEPRRPRPRRRLWRRQVADRRRPAVPGDGAGRRRVRARLGRPGDAPRQRRGSRAADPDRAADDPGHAVPRPVRPRLPPGRPARAAGPGRIPAGVLGRRGARAAGSWSWTGACRTIPRDQSLHARLLWGIQIDELYQGTRMLSRRASSSSTRAPACRRRPRSTCCRARPCSTSSSRPDRRGERRGARDGRRPVRAAYWTWIV